VDESALQGGDHGLRAIADTESAQHVGDVTLDGRLRDRQLRRDLAIALARSVPQLDRAVVAAETSRL